MKNENGMPGHSTIKDDVFKAIASMELFKNRPQVILDKESNKVHLIIDPAVYGEVTEEGIKDFALLRLFDYDVALRISEGQLMEILTEDPFIPEELGFTLIHAPQTIHDSPIRLYESQFHPGMTIHRPIDPLDGTHDNSVWIVTTKTENGVFETTKLKLPCHRIAYAAFFALGIQMEEEESAGQESAPEVTAPNTNSKTNMFDVIFSGFGEFTIAQVPAYTAKDAIAAAKFIVETDHEMYGLEMGAITDFDQYKIKE